MTFRKHQKLTVSRRSVLQCAGVLAIGAVLPRFPVFGQSREPIKTYADQAKLQSVVEFLENERAADALHGGFEADGGDEGKAWGLGLGAWGLRVRFAIRHRLRRAEVGGTTQLNCIPSSARSSGTCSTRRCGR